MRERKAEHRADGHPIFKEEDSRKKNEEWSETWPEN